MAQENQPMLSLLMPSKGETQSLWQTMDTVRAALVKENISHEFVVVNDVKIADEGGTASKMAEFQAQGWKIQYIERLPPLGGFGSAVRTGLEAFSAPAVVILMADGSEDPADVVRFYRKYQEGFDCVFGDRFVKGGSLVGYPGDKLPWNRLANWLISLMFFIPYRDFTNASKLYSRKTIEGLKPIFSEHFNITIELPIKAFIRGFKVAVIPNTWRSDETRISNLRIGAMGKRYAYTALKIFWER